MIRSFFSKKGKDLPNGLDAYPITRSQFPLLADQDVVYLDNACMTQRPKEVIDAVSFYYTHYGSCAGRSNHTLSRALTQHMTKCRAGIASFIGAQSPSNIIFTKNTTEAINLVAYGLRLSRGDVIIISDKEHNSNLVPWLHMASTTNCTIKVVGTDAQGHLNIPAFQEMLDACQKQYKRVRLVAMSHISNIDGVEYPIDEIVRRSHDAGALVLLDGAQAAGHIEVNVAKLGVDFYAWSAHKMMGPSGMGALYGTTKALAELSQFIVGGQTVASTTHNSFVPLGAPEKFEAGLQDYAGIAGFFAACEFISRVQVSQIHKHVLALHKIVLQELASEIAHRKIVVIGPSDPHAATGIFNFYVPSMDSHEVALLLDNTFNISVRSGQHCVHAYYTKHKLPASVRASFYAYNTEKEARLLVSAIKDILLMKGK